MDKTRKNYIFEINENDLYMKNKDNENKNNSSKTFKKNIWINTNNIIGKETIFNNINSIVTENKEKIKNNKREISDLIDLIKFIRIDKECNDPIIIYTGYEPGEDFITETSLRHYPNIIIKWGRFLLGYEPHYDEILGVNLASDNQHAEKIT